MRRLAVLAVVGFAALSSCALTREEVVARFRAPPVTQVSGLVQVRAGCPSDLRQAFQMPVAGFAAEICRTLYRAENVRERKFERPGIVLHLGDVRTNETNVVVRASTREDGSSVTHIRLLAPEFASPEAVRTAVVQGFYRSVRGEELSAGEAAARLRHADPVLRAADEQAQVVAWRDRGEYAPGMDDEAYLKLQRKVLVPGSYSHEDVHAFAAHLMLYPLSFGAPFSGRYAELTFHEALGEFRRDPQVRYAALLQASRVVVFGGGRGERMDAVAQAFSDFLFALARAERSDAELAAMLDRAEVRLEGLLTESRGE